MKPIEDRLRETISLDAASVGPSLIHRAVRQRMRSLGLKRPEDYLRYLENSRAEWHELVESVVVTETWFFRDPEPIAAFVHLVREEWLPARTTALDEIFFEIALADAEPRHALQQRPSLVGADSELQHGGRINSGPENAMECCRMGWMTGCSSCGGRDGQGHPSAEGLCLHVYNQKEPSQLESSVFSPQSLDQISASFPGA